MQKGWHPFPLIATFTPKISDKLRRHIRGLYHPINFDWASLSGYRSGIPTTRSEPTPYISKEDPDFQGVWESYWRDVPDRLSMEERFSAFCSSKRVQLNTCAESRAWERVRSHLAHIRGLKPWTVGESYDSMPHSTSPGLPFVRYGIFRKSDAAKGIKDSVRTWIRSVKSGRKWRDLPVLPCMAGARRVVRERGKNNPRLVWVYPAGMTCLEGRYALPISAALKSADWIGWSVNWLDGGASRNAILRQSVNMTAIASIDFSSFDANVAARFARKAFHLIEECFDLSNEDRELFKLVVEYFVHTPILMYSGVKQKHRGVPSGSYFTQLVDTLVNMFYCFYVDEVQSDQDGSRIVTSACKWLGDDSRLVFKIWYGETSFRTDFLGRFQDLGAIVSPDKTSVVVLSDESSSYGSFLSREILCGYPHLGINFAKFKAQLLIPEDQDLSESVFLARLIGLAWAYGFDERCYAILARLKGTLRSDCEPHFQTRFLMSYVYALGFSLSEISSFPSFERVHSRYFGYV